MLDVRPEFKMFVDRLDEKFERLLAMSPVTAETIPSTAPKGGVYLFGTLDKPLYVGRTKQPIAKRIVGHIDNSPDSPFAFRLARERTGRTTGQYTKQQSRKTILQDEGFLRAFEAAKREIKRMEPRWVDESDPTKQALLEIYVATVLKTPYNDFDTH